MQKNYLIGLRAQFHQDIPVSSEVLRHINGHDKKLFSRPRFAEFGYKTCQRNGLQEHTEVVTFICYGYNLTDDQRHGNIFPNFEPDAEVVFWSILPRQICHGIALDEHRKLPGRFSEDENKYSMLTIRFEACLLNILELVNRAAPCKERWIDKSTFECSCLE